MMHLTEQQKVRFKQIEAQAKHMRSIQSELRWKLFAEFQNAVAREYLRSLRRRHPTASQNELNLIAKQELMSRYERRKHIRELL